MIKRFQIEDLISQDLSGVLFRALDTQSGKTVAVRRFFPFGADGGGLDADEQIAYEIALGRLAGLTHPALRSVISGGCDPVDHMPFIVTEWIEGESLDSWITGNGLSVESTILMITRALEVCELFSHVLDEEAIWVETDLQTIIVSGPESSCGFTFWICPLKWLGGSKDARGLEAIVKLAEQIMGWTGRVVSDQSGGGLGGWLKWLRKNATTITLQEARESLAALVGAGPPPPTAQLVAEASNPPSWKPPSKIPLIVALVLGLLVSALLLTFVLPRNSSPVHASQATHVSASGPIQWDDHAALVRRDKKQVIIEGTSESIDFSSSGKTVYLLFSSEEDRDAARVGIEIGKATKEEVAKKLQPYVGKKIRVSGKVKVQNVSELNRPDIMMKNVSAVEIIE